MEKKPIKVVVHGAAGRMGREVLSALCRHKGVEPVGAIDKVAREDYLSLPDGSGLIPYSSTLEPVILRTHPQVVVDFSNAEATLPVARTAASYGVNLVIGTTGLSQDALREIEILAREKGIGAVVAPNFALGAVLMIELAKRASPFFDYVEVIEMHHEGKADAPSGTALATARAMVEARGKPFTRKTPEKEPLKGTRGGEVDGVSLHSLRMPGLLAHQEVIFGSLGQTLSIRHDTISRECYIPGIMMAIEKVVGMKGMVYGLEKLLFS